MLLFSKGVKAKFCIRFVLDVTLIDCENRLKRIKHEGDADHDGPDTHA